jgi:Co/Zn/Cd efflux system component
MFFVLHANVCGQSLPHHGHSHGDHHGHTHSHADESLSVEIASGGHNHEIVSQNINVRAAIIHVIGDFVQSLGVLFAAILIKIKVCKISIISQVDYETVFFF